MDLSTLMLSQNIAMMPQAGSAEMMSPHGPDASQDFGNLLSLVEGMETAEMSMGSEEALENLMKEVEMPEQEGLKGQKFLAQSNLGGEMLVGSMNLPLKQAGNLGNETSVEMINQINVGQPGPSNGQAEILSGTGILTANSKAGPNPASMADLDALENFSRENFSLAQLGQKQGMKAEKLNLDSVAAWSQGLASKEIKSVSVEASADPVVSQKLQAQEGLDLKGLQRKAPTSEAQLLSSGASATLNVPREGKLEGFVQAKPVAVPSVSDEASMSEFETKRSLKIEPKQESSDQPMFAKDFMLGQMTASKLAKSDSGIAFDSSKVSTEVADFVAEKVDQLQNSGQETLRVKMDSKDLGGLDIKVTLKRGLVDVDIRAARPESQAILDSSRSQLKSQLAKVVDLGGLDVGVDVKAMNHAKISSDSAAASLSHDVVRAMSKGDGSEARIFSQNSTPANHQHSHLSEVGATEQSQDMDSSQEFSRDEKREQAMTQWQQFINHRQSA